MARSVVSFLTICTLTCHFLDSPCITLAVVLMLRVGLDLTNGCVCDNKKAGVLEPAVSKIKSLKFATEAAITILRIDDMIKMFPEDKKHRSEELD